MTLNQAQRFVRDNAKRIIASSTDPEIVELAEAALKLNDAYEAEANALVQCNDHGLKAW